MLPVTHRVVQIEACLPGGTLHLNSFGWFKDDRKVFLKLAASSSPFAENSPHAKEEARSEPPRSMHVATELSLGKNKLTVIQVLP